MIKYDNGSSAGAASHWICTNSAALQRFRKAPVSSLMQQNEYDIVLLSVDLLEIPGGGGGGGGGTRLFCSL